MSYLKLVGVSKKYGPVHAVREAALDVAAGEFVSLLGPSGSGKTTTLMMIAGFEEPTEGSILLGGRPIEHVPPYRRDIGMVFQNYALFPHLSVKGNVAYPLRVRRRPRAEITEAVARTLTLVGLEDKADRLPRQLSGGQQQRVALARALVYQPKLLLLDEPLSALDKTLREQMQIELRGLHQRVGITTLYVTHDQSEAMALSDRIVVFNRGRIEQVGTPLDVYNRPISRFAATFIGDSNILDGQSSACRTELVLACGARMKSMHPLLAGSDGSASLLVRPEHITIGQPPVGLSATALGVQVDNVLNMGASSLIIGRHGSAEIRIRTALAASEIPHEGETVPVWWETTKSWPVPVTPRWT